MLDVLGHGVWALAVRAALFSWEELLSASLSSGGVCALLAYVIGGMSGTLSWRREGPD